MQLANTPPLQSTTPGLHPVSIHQTSPLVRGSKHPITAYYWVYRPRMDERLSRPAWLVTYRNKVPPPGVEPVYVTHPSTNRARRRVTSLIRPTPFPLRHELRRVTASYGVFWISEKPVRLTKFKRHDVALEVRPGARQVQIRNLGLTGLVNVTVQTTSFTIRFQCIQGESWKYFMCQKNGLHAFGYNSTESEPIWMKFGTLWTKWRGLALADFGRDLRSSDSLKKEPKFCFFLSGK